MVPVVVSDELDAIVEVAREAFEEMGAESKVSHSDIVSEALTEYVTSWHARHGPIPSTAPERREYVRKVAAALTADARAQLTRRT